MFKFIRPQPLPKTPPSWWKGGEEMWEIHREDMYHDALLEAEAEYYKYHNEESEED